ncbi:MAG: hypothetical protein ACOYOB_07195 [Myxococcota bacterium]
MTVSLALVLVLCGLPPPAHAEPPSTADGSLLATGAALVPGFLLHGSGHFVLGERGAAGRLLLIEGVGVLGIVGGIGVLGGVGGSEKLAPVYVPVAVGGAALFFGSWIADLVGSAHGSHPWPEPARAGAEKRVGLSWQSLWSTPFAFTQAAEAGLALRGERAGLSAFLTAAPTGGLLGGGAAFSWRAVQAADTPLDTLDVVAGIRHLAYRADGFGLSVGEVYAEGRWNLRHIAPTLANAWALGRLGAGVDVFDFDPNGHGARDARSLLVVDAGLGVQAHRDVRVELLYRHRKDELPGGFLGTGSAGFLGFLQGDAHIDLTPDVAVTTSVRWGRGVWTCLGLETRF